MSPYYEDLREKVGHQLLLVPSVAAVIRDAEGKVLLQEKASGEPWSLPAGAIEPGESPSEALHREVLEETGFIVEIKQILGVFGGPEYRYTYPNGDMVEYTIIVYRCEIAGRATKSRDAETSSLRYFGPGQMPPLALPYSDEVLFGTG